MKSALSALEEVHVPQDGKIVFEDFFKYMNDTSIPRKIVYLGFYLTGDYDNAGFIDIEKFAKLVKILTF